MPNYEIYYGDLHAILDGVAASSEMVAVDSTDYFAKRTDTKYEIYRDARPIGRLTFRIETGSLTMGKLFVDESYRSWGVSQLLVMLALAYGVRQGVTGARLSEEVADHKAQGFFGVYRLQFREQPSSIADALAGAELGQVRLARKLRLARSPYTLLLNTDRPRGNGPQGDVPVLKRRGSTGKY